MKKIALVFVVLILSLAQACAGSMTLLGAGSPPASTPSYTGPCDIQSGVVEYWSLRACGASQMSGTTKSVQIVDASGANPQDIFITTSGFANWSAIAAYAVTCSCTPQVATIYGQMGTRNLTQGTASQQPTLVSALGGKYTMRFVAASLQSLGAFAGPIIGSQPITVSTFMNSDTIASGSRGVISDANTGTLEVTANSIGLSAGSGTIAATNDGATWHAVVVVFNGASSNFNLDGTDNTFSNSGTSMSGANMGRGSSDFMDGDLTEFAVFNVVPTSPAAINSNAHTQWGS